VSDIDMWAVIVGALLPAVVAAINRVNWPPWLKGVVAIATSIVAGGVTAYLTGQLTGATWVHAGVVVAGAALATYRWWWHPTGIAPAIERTVNPGPPLAALVASSKE
jgi:hypothetical protein